MHVSKPFGGARGGGGGLHHVHYVFFKTGSKRFSPRTTCPQRVHIPAFSGAHKWAKMLHNPCILGGPQTKRDKIRIGCLNLAFSGAHKWVEMLHNP